LILKKSGQRQVAGSCESGDGPSSLITCGIFLDSMRNC